MIIIIRFAIANKAEIKGTMVMCGNCTRITTKDDIIMIPDEIRGNTIGAYCFLIKYKIKEGMPIACESHIKNTSSTLSPKLMSIF